MTLYQSRPQIAIFTNHLMIWPKNVFLLLAFVAFLPTMVQAQNCHETNKQALIALYDATDGPNWTNTWDLEESITNWDGLSFDSDGCVTSINLSNNNLVGSIPEEFCQLTALTIINLMGNYLSGHLPDCIGDLSRVEMFFMSDNQLSGSIPEGIGNMKQLIGLFLEYNQLGGSIPDTIGSLTSAHYIFMRNNQLNGTIPSSIGNLSNLINLNLISNQLSDSIPAELGQLSNLESLWLSDNQLTGSIPTEIDQLNNLNSLGLDNNSLSGSLPVELGNLSNLSLLHLNHNEITGALPETLTQLPYLEELFLNNNSLSGCFPESYKQLCSIWIDVSNNPDLPKEGDFQAFCNGDLYACKEAPVNCIAFSVEGEEDACYSTRQIAISITYGSPMFTVSLEGPITGSAMTSSRAFRIQNVPVGTYKITIVDANDCEEIKVLSIKSGCQFDRDNTASTSRNNPTETTLTIADFETVKSELQVSTHYPNPFTQSTTLPFALTKASDLNISVLTAAGQEVYQLQQTFDAGAHQLTLDAGVFSQAGVYIYHIQHGEELITGKLIRL